MAQNLYRQIFRRGTALAVPENSNRFVITSGARPAASPPRRVSGQRSAQQNPIGIPMPSQSLGVPTSFMRR